jgi:membrane associated rhomboid family serine protease
LLFIGTKPRYHYGVLFPLQMNRGFSLLSILWIVVQTVGMKSGEQSLTSLFMVIGSNVVIYSYLYFWAGGIAHIGLNVIVGCLYGCIFEMYHPFGHIAFGILYQLSIVLGALGHAAIWPYRGIYGCSAGVYGLIGGCWCLILFNKDSIDTIIYFSLLITLIVQFIFDFLYYCFFYSDTVSYAGHAIGFYTGVCLGLSFGLFYVKEKWKKGVAIVACCGLVVEIAYLYHHFYSNWPPVAYQQSFLHNNIKHNDDCYVRLNS